MGTGGRSGNSPWSVHAWFRLIRGMTRDAMHGSGCSATRHCGRASRSRGEKSTPTVSSPMSWRRSSPRCGVSSRITGVFPPCSRTPGCGSGYSESSADDRLVPQLFQLGFELVAEIAQAADVIARETTALECRNGATRDRGTWYRRAERGRRRPGCVGHGYGGPLAAAPPREVVVLRTKEESFLRTAPFAPSTSAVRSHRLPLGVVPLRRLSALSLLPSRRPSTMPRAPPSGSVHFNP